MTRPAIPCRWLVGLCSVLLTAACATTPDPRRMTFAPVPLTEPEVTEVRLDNGLTLYLLPDRSLPLIHMRALVGTGRVYEPPDGVHVYRLASHLMRDGGAGDMEPDAFDEALAFAAIRMDSHIGPWAGGASVDTLTRTFPLALERFADMLRRPRFDPERLKMAKARAIEGIRRRNDRPGAIARRAFARALYGPDHPLAREATVEEVKRITRDDLIAFHRTFYRPGNIRLGVTGDFEIDEMVAAIKGAFGDWEAPPVDLPQPPPVPATERRVVYVAHKPVDQVSIRIGQTTLRRDDPDYYALALADRILGRSPFTSRLFQELRTRAGLVYAVSSNLQPGHETRGLFRMGTRTRSGKAGEAVGRMLAEVERLRTEPVPPDELAAAKEAFLNAFVFNSVTAEQAVNRRMRQDYHGMPPDELQRVRERILAATADDVLRVARDHLDPDRMVIVAVGDREVLTEALAPFGEVVEVSAEDFGTPAGT